MLVVDRQRLGGAALERPLRPPTPVARLSNASHASAASA
jgi:hypothetical protein